MRQIQYDKSRLNALFRRLRKDGLMARQNFSCCMSCGCFEIATDYGDLRDQGQGEALKGYVFYHKQDTDGLKRTGRLALRFGQLGCYRGEKEMKYKGPLTAEQVADLIVTACKDLKVKYEWNSDVNTVIALDLKE
jgi:hypothetical protein